MDHNEAMSSQICEKYLLGELSHELREAFEDHFFSCSECAMQVRAAVAFAGSSREVLSASPARIEPAAVRVSGRWFSWLHPLTNPFVAAPAFAVLLLFVAYQNLVTIPQWKHAAAPRVLPMFSLITADTRGDEGLRFSVPPGVPFGVYVDVPASPEYTSYSLRLVDPNGTASPLHSVSAAEAQRTQVVIVNPGKLSGKYSIVVWGSSATGRVSEKELARLQFIVAVQN